jgi:L-asparagine oxygenase
MLFDNDNLNKKLNDNSNNVIELTYDEMTTLTNLAVKITADPTDNPELFCKQSKECSENVPWRIKKQLQDFELYGNENGFLLIKMIDLPDISIPKTPDGNNKRIGEKTIFARIQSILINVIAEMISYEAEGYGRLFQDLIPMKSMETEQTSVGSNAELEIHTEQAFSKLRPDILSLACLRGDSDAFTYILPIQKLLDNLTDNEILQLYKPLWKIGVDLSFKLNNKEFIEGDIRGPIPILNGSYIDPILVFDQDLMIGITDEATQLKEKIINIYYEYRNKHNLVPGEIMLIDNLRSVHGRSPFSPRYDGYDRFLIRCFAVFNYAKSIYARDNINNTRMVSAIYS